MPPVHEALENISWLIGKWRCNEGRGVYPTIAPFKYCEEIEFKSYGQPLLVYSARSWNPETSAPMHFESGYLRAKPGTGSVSFMVAHNFGLTTIEEGEASNCKIVLKSNQISRMSHSKEPAVTKIERVFTFNNSQLEQVLHMATTSTTDLTEHLRCTYTRCIGDT